MKQFIAILFSLLLVAAQTFAVAVPGSSGSCAVKGCCCGEDCDCHVDPGGDSSAPPAESTIPASASTQLVLLPAERVLFEISFAEMFFSVPGADASLSAASQPLFRLNCVLLI